MKISKFRTRFSLISSGKGSEEKQIFLVCTIIGVEIFYYSGYRIYKDNFIKEKVSLSNSVVYIQQVKKNTFNKAGDPASRINARLRELENAAQKVYETNFQGTDTEYFNKEKFKELLQIELGEQVQPETNNKGLIEIYEQYKNIVNVSEGRRRHIKCDIERLRNYISMKKRNIDEKNFNTVDYKKYLLESMSENSSVSVLKRMKAFFNYAKKEKIFDGSPFDGINIGVEVYSEPVCMTREELKQLYESKMPDPQKEIVKDMFCLQAALGCRVGDLVRLKMNNIQNDQLIYFPNKTSEFANKVVVPLSNRAKEILKKYKGRSELLMPFLHPNDYNELLKAVFRIAKLDRTIIKYNRDKKKEEFFKLHELATTHLARRTFVDILCQAGEPIHVVASMSGHSENSKAFARYKRRPEQLQKDAVSRSMD